MNAADILQRLKNGEEFTVFGQQCTLGSAVADGVYDYRILDHRSAIVGWLRMEDEFVFIKFYFGPTIDVDLTDFVYEPRQSKRITWYPDDSPDEL